MVAEVNAPMLQHNGVGFQYQLDMCCVSWGDHTLNFS